MTTVLDCSYQRMDPYGRQDGDADDEDDREETPQDMIIHMVEGNKARWNHIEDLDSFFTRMYHYHQKHGFACMMLQEIFELTRIIFVVAFSTFLSHCVDYSILFKYVIVLFIVYLVPYRTHGKRFLILCSFLEIKLLIVPRPKL